VTIEGQQTPTLLPATTAAPNGSALALVRLPYTFTQDDLWRTDDVIKEATRRGLTVDLQTLKRLHEARLLLPLFRIADSASEGRRIEVNAGEPLSMNPRGWVMHAAVEGRLRDPADEGYCVAWSYARPPDEPNHRWWNGFIYSSWQLLELADALRNLTWLDHGFNDPQRGRRAADRRGRTLALVALSGRHLTNIRGQISVPSGLNFEDFHEARFEIGEVERLDLVAYRADKLLPDAEALLLSAHGDPLIHWWPIIRHAGHEGWDKLDGVSAHHLWSRLGAEVLLRAHEELAEEGVLPPLPDLAGANWWTELHDRVNSERSGGKSLERALGAFGLSPHPKVLLLVEGDTEMLHLPRLLDLFGLNRPHLVRVQNCRSSKVNPQLISRYAIAPRLAERLGDSQMTESHPTCLVVAMDPENDWSDEAKRLKKRAALQNAIREEVEAQGGQIGQGDLDWLVTIHVWGEHKYELANFTDDELAGALTALAHEQARGGDDIGLDQVRAEVSFARAGSHDIKVTFQRLSLRVDKPRLAELLWPTLLAKCEGELASGDVVTPVLAVVNDVRSKVALNSSGNYSLSPFDALEDQAG